MRTRILAVLLTASACLLPAAERATLTGTITDSQGKPLQDATVMIYQAGLKHGYSTYCPSCYLDCGKRTLTDASGAYTVKDLDPDLWFKLVVIHDGYTATFANKVDPVAGPANTVALTPRAPVDDPTRVVRGRVVDSHGLPMRSAVITPEGIHLLEGPRGKPTSMYGTVKGLEPLAVTNAKGEFELAHTQKAEGMMLRVEARGMAPKILAAPTGEERTTITVSEGSVVRGRLMNHGKPVGGAEVGLIAKERGGYGWQLKIFGNPYSEIRIGTQPDGTFVIPNVPTGIDWLVYGKMESIASLGASDPVEIASKADNDEVEAGDLEIRPGHRFRGKITLSDGTAIPEGMRVTISAKQAWDSQTATIGPDGSFEFKNVPTGKFDLSPSVKGYTLPENKFGTEAAVEKDIDDFSVSLEKSARR
jgi:hypothetical protein